jgi:hypothetical protein
MSEVKGVQVRATIQYLKERFGEEAVEGQINALSPDVRYLLPALLLDSNWYPYSVWRPVRRISRALSDETGDGVAISLGKFIAQYVFTGVYKSLLTPDPAKQLAKFPGIHEFFYKDTSTIETEVLSPTSGLVRYLYNQGVRPARSSCQGTMGFWIRTLELSGAANVKAKHSKCITEGEDVCLYDMHWGV